MPHGSKGDNVGMESSPNGGSSGNSFFPNRANGEGGGMENASVPNGSEGDNTRIRKASG